MLIKKNMTLAAITALLFATVVIYGIPIQSAAAGHPRAMPGNTAGAPIATSANNVYIAWNNNDTGHWNVFFLKCTDGRKTFEKNMMLIAPNKGQVVYKNVQIAAW